MSPERDDSNSRPQTESSVSHGVQWDKHAHEEAAGWCPRCGTHRVQAGKWVKDVHKLCPGCEEDAA